VPLSCRHNQPSATARSIPARNCSPLPPAASRQKRFVHALDVDAAILLRFHIVRDLDELASCGIGIGERTISGKLHRALSLIGAAVGIQRRSRTSMQLCLGSRPIREDTKQRGDILHCIDRGLPAVVDCHQNMAGSRGPLPMPGLQPNRRRRRFR
jgi:hypothetical protein